MIAAVFDCMVFLQAATRRTGPAAACLNLVDERRVRLFVSAAILAEVQNVLNQPAFRKRFPTLADQDVQDFIEHIADRGQIIEAIPAVFQLPRDPDDEPYINLAAAAGASFLVSRDKDLLSLMDDEGFRKQFPGLSIVDPKAFLDHVRSTTAKNSVDA
jgi:putative PIN family toxin of toxin-antitoxin system